MANKAPWLHYDTERLPVIGLGAAGPLGVSFGADANTPGTVVGSLDDSGNAILAGKLTLGDPSAAATGVQLQQGTTDNGQPGVIIYNGDHSNVGSIEGRFFLALGGAGGAMGVHDGVWRIILSEGAGVGLAFDMLLGWTAAGDATGAYDVRFDRSGAGALRLELDAGGGLAQAVGFSFTGVNDDTTMVLTCRIAGVETQKRVTRDPITKALFAI